MKVSSLLRSIARDLRRCRSKYVLEHRCPACFDEQVVFTFLNEVTMNDLILRPARRQAVTGIAVALVSAFSGALSRAQQPSMGQQPSENSADTRTSIHYELDFKSSPQRFYEVIVDQKQFAAFTGLPATIDATAGGAFSMFGGLIVGRTVELVPGQRIVQAWRPTHWDPGVYSILHFELKPREQECALVFDHTGFPAGEYDHLDWGWKNHYWEPLKKYFA
jgi:activator of HSP90 ATPase